MHDICRFDENGINVVEIVVKISRVLTLKCTKSYVGCRFAPDPAGGAYSAPQSPRWIYGALLLRGEEGKRGKGNRMGTEKGRGERRDVRGREKRRMSCTKTILGLGGHDGVFLAIWQTTRKLLTNDATYGVRTSTYSRNRKVGVGFSEHDV